MTKAYIDGDIPVELSVHITARRIEPIKCPNCNGRGYMEFNPYDDHEWLCTRCGGQGKIDTIMVNTDDIREELTRHLETLTRLNGKVIHEFPDQEGVWLHSSGGPPITVLKKEGDLKWRQVGQTVWFNINSLALRNWIPLWI